MTAAVPCFALHLARTWGYSAGTLGTQKHTFVTAVVLNLFAQVARRAIGDNGLNSLAKATREYVIRYHIISYGCTCRWVADIFGLCQRFQKPQKICANRRHLCGATNPGDSVY